MAVKKIALMQQEFGLCDAHTCGECSNLLRQSVGNRAVFKCKVYGNTASTASDWAKWYLACGMFNKSWNGKPLIRLVGRGSKEPQAQPDEPSGQMSLFWSKRNTRKEIQLMDRLTKINPDDNFSIAMNYAFAEGNKVILRHTGEKENAELCSFISEQAKKYGCDITAEEVEGGCCFECMNCPMAVMVAVATQAAELRHRLMLIEDILGDKYDLDDLRQLMAARRKGQLYFIPCKPGDTVYTLKKTWAGDITGKIEAGIVKNIEGDTSWVAWYKQASGNPEILHALKIEEYQQTWFLSQEEAEAALLAWHEGKA